MEDNVIHIYTDGACSGNPGPMGVGVILYYNGHIKKRSLFEDHGTNQQAEILAIIRGLEIIEDTTIPLKIYTDSAYCVGLFSKSWKVKANLELVSKCKNLLETFDNYIFVKVKGHSRDILNQQVDRLAVDAYIRKRK